MTDEEIRALFINAITAALPGLTIAFDNDDTDGNAEQYFAEAMITPSTDDSTEKQDRSRRDKTGFTQVSIYGRKDIKYDIQQIRYIDQLKSYLNLQDFGKITITGYAQTSGRNDGSHFVRDLSIEWRMIE